MTIVAAMGLERLLSLVGTRNAAGLAEEEAGSPSPSRGDLKAAQVNILSSLADRDTRQHRSGMS